jgi:UDP-N-acetylglucosamine 2-epimerase (non-hydrolysing)/GDP/UDP-N,N'-diacetylbacillosamine 2-epimerase (hydrolysing)
MPVIRKVCVVTGSRAEYGILQPLLTLLSADPDVELQLVVTGMHLSAEFGLTYKVIEADGFTIARKIEMLLSGDSPPAITKSIGLGVIGFADAFAALRPDLLVLLGDRFEILAAAQAALVARIPIAHIHGGEITEGAIDDPIRHAVTKMSHYHFTSAEPHRRRVIQLGEDPERVFNFGAIGHDSIAGLRLLDRTALEAALGVALGATNFLVTYHPVTLSKVGPAAAMAALFGALDRFPAARVIFTKPNSDTDGRIIATLIDNYCAANPARAVARTSLGQLRYLSAVKHVDVVIGNSSSGLIEVPELGKPTVNIGDRQRGRLKADSVIDCADDAGQIAAAIEKALSPQFRAALPSFRSPYHGDNVSARIAAVLKSAKLDDVLMKRFHDLGGPSR